MVDTARSLIKSSLAPTGSSSNSTLFPPSYLAIAGAIRTLDIMGVVNGTAPVTVTPVPFDLTGGAGTAAGGRGGPTASASGKTGADGGATPAVLSGGVSSTATITIQNPVRSSLQNCTTLMNNHPAALRVLSHKGASSSSSGKSSNTNANNASSGTSELISCSMPGGAYFRSHPGLKLTHQQALLDEHAVLAAGSTGDYGGSSAGSTPAMGDHIKPYTGKGLVVPFRGEAGMPFRGEAGIM